MSTAEIIPPGSAGGTDIVATVMLTPAIVFASPDAAKQLIAKIEAEVAAFIPDLATAKGRGECAALAFKITKTKTAIDAAGADLVEEARKTVKKTDVERKTFRDRLDELRDQARKPLDDWEQAEKDREIRSRATIAKLEQLGKISVEDTAETVRNRWTDIKAFVLDEGDLGDFVRMARMVLHSSEDALEHAYARLVREEQDRRELERLRKEQAERERLDQLLTFIAEVRNGTIGGKPQAFGILIHEIEDLQARDSDAAPLQPKVKEALSEAHAHLTAQMEEQGRQREARERTEAEERAKTKAETEAKEKADKRIKAAQAETQRLKDAETARVAEEERKAKEQADREADIEHRKDVQVEARNGFMKAGLSAPAADKAVNAIAAGLVPGVTINY